MQTVYKIYCLHCFLAQKNALSTLDNIIVAWLAGSINALATSPLWVVAGRIKSQYKHGEVHGGVHGGVHGEVHGEMNVEVDDEVHGGEVGGW